MKHPLLVPAFFVLATSAIHSPAQPEVPAEFARGSSAAAGDLSRWWESFRDPQLNRLIAAALAGNNDLFAAAARVREARQRRLEAAADFWPQLRTSVGVTREKISQGSRFGTFPGLSPQETMFSATLDASWEIDIFGRTRQATRAAAAEADAAEESRRDVLVSLLAEVAGNYVELRGLQARLAVLRQNAASQEKTVELTKSRQKAGLSPELVVAQAEAQLATTRAAIPDLESAAAQAMHRLALLCGRGPMAFAGELSSGRGIPTGPPGIPAGLPSQLLLRRPDVRMAERKHAAAAARLGVAKANRMPQFSISASAGYESRESQNWLNKQSETWRIGPQVSIPLFTGGKLKAQQKAAQEALAQAQSAWDQAVLTAVADVEDALIAYQKSQKRLSALREAETASNRALTLAQDLYKNGLGDFLNVLESQRTVLAAQEQVVMAQREVSVNLVKLYKALGGGWENDAAPNPGKSPVAK